MDVLAAQIMTIAHHVTITFIFIRIDVRYYVLLKHITTLKMINVMYAKIQCAKNAPLLVALAVFIHILDMIRIALKFAL